ncbi:MAG: VWA domain-containing protein [Deltaproteobacteria bacterium]|nr:VWA domain-containing protein [Deltaproteobacteria bacterium]
MRLAASTALLCSAALAHSETALTEDNGTSAPAPTRQLFEAACDMTIDLRASIAQVEVRQRIVNPGPDAMAATYELDLPTGATITAFALRGAAGVETALAIPGPFNSVDASDRPVLGPDPALLTRQPPDATAQYAVRLQPIPADHEVTLITKYTMVGQVHAGAIRVVLPGRANIGKLTACRGTVRATPGPGTTLAGITIGKTVTTKATAPFVLDDRDLPIDANLSFAGKEPVVWTQTQPIVDGWSATVVTVAAPPIRTTSTQTRRALFVIDGSRSMELVGRGNVSKVVDRIARALPAGVELEGIIYDRTAQRVLKGWKPESMQTVAELVSAVQKHVPQNGSTLTSAFELAHTAITDGARAQTMVIVITDGVLGDVTGNDLIKALALKTSTVDVLTVVLDPGRTTAPDADVLRAPVNLYGGSFVELSADDIDNALLVVDDWLRPSWLELAMGNVAIPATVRAGSGFTRTIIHPGAASRFSLTGHGDLPFAITPRAGPSAPVATLALATISDGQTPFSADPDPDDTERARATRVLKKALAAHPFARDGLAFAVLSTQGKVARNRIAMVKGGGPYERVTAVDDPSGRATSSATYVKPPVPPKPTAIAKITLERLFRDQLQPKAFACYQRALARSPRLTGTILFALRLGRGEVTQVNLTGTTDQPFEDCLRDAAFTLTVPFPDFSVNADDQTLAHYPLTFNLSEAKPVIVLGDADSTSPLDIDSIQGGVPNSATPLGDLRPNKNP